MDDQGNMLTHITALDKRMTDGFEAINARLSDQAQAVHGRLDDLSGDAMRARFHDETEGPEEGSVP